MNNKAILFVFLIVVTVLSFNINIAEANVIDDELLIAQYDRIFGNNENISDQIKIQVIISMINNIEIQLSKPQDQDRVAQQVLEILEWRDNAKSNEEKIKLQEKLDEKTELMLQVGLVLAEEYRKDPAKWSKALDETSDSKYRTKIEENKDSDIKPAVYDENYSNLTFVSGDSFKASIYHKFWCHNGFMLCTSTSYIQNMNFGDLFTTSYTLPDYSWYGQLIPYHKVKNISGNYLSDVNTQSWVAIKQISNWQDSCYDDNLWNFIPSKTHYWSVCNSAASSSGNQIYHTLLIE